MHRILITITDSCTLLQRLDEQKALEVPRSHILNQCPEIQHFCFCYWVIICCCCCWSNINMVLLGFLCVMLEHTPRRWSIFTMFPHISLRHTQSTTSRATRGISTLQTSCIYQQTHERKQQGQPMQWSQPSSSPMSKWISIWLDVTDKVKAFAVTVPILLPYPTHSNSSNCPLKWILLHHHHPHHLQTHLHFHSLSMYTLENFNVNCANATSTT